MKILKLLNNLFFLTFFLLILNFNHFSFSNEPEDIWKIDPEAKEINKLEDSEAINEESISLINIPNNNQQDSIVFEEDNLEKDNIALVGFYDPEENGLTIDMWSNTDGNEIKSIFSRLNKINLSPDANEILEIAILTNSYFPKKNISIEEFVKFKNDFLIEKNNLKLIKEYLLKNRKAPSNEILIKYYVDHYLTNADLENSCSIFDDIKNFNDDYLSKFKIYCLINEDKKDEAQLLYDLIIENGFKDSFFDKQFNFLMGYNEKNPVEISEKNILNFHLSHRTNLKFKYEPNENTKKEIWKYLSSSNLLEDIALIDLENSEKIKIIESATHENNYSEEELFELYKRFQFNFNQLLNVKDTYKLMPSFEGRALLYQKLLLTIDTNEKLNLASMLKKSFEEDNIENAFVSELLNILSNIDVENVPSNFSKFYSQYSNNKNLQKKNIKFNNKIVHQSKLLNYFLDKLSIEKTEKDANDLLKKIKRDKKYFFSTKDIIMVETLKSDGIKISNKYENLYDAKPQIPPDIQALINNDEKGMVLLRISEIIGADKLEDLGPDDIYFIVSVLNQLNIDKPRNNILLKVLPLKV
tara:strand:+ start:213 stop:1964 length:1752 start_codon:yes stop_codon:yes gene_type:complete